MKKTNKKGFTIVELVIVIAVIAILAAVLIPNISRLVKKANQSADESLVRNLNTALAMDAEKHTTMSAALKAAYENGGYDVAKIVTKNDDAKILWDSLNDCFVYLNGSDKVYLPNTQTEKKVKDVDLFEIVSEVPAVSEQKYSIYLTGISYNKAVTVAVGFDAGNNKDIPSVTYKHTGDEQNVIVNTTGGTLSVEAAKDSMKHYGEADSVSIIAINTASYHEFGNIDGNIDIAAGHIKVENGANVNGITITTTEIKKNSNGIYNVSVDVNSNANVDFITATETIEFNEVVKKPETTKIIDTKTQPENAVAYDLTTGEFQTELTIKNGSHIILLKDITGSFAIYRSAKIDLNGHTISAQSQPITISTDLSSGDLVLEITGTGMIKETLQDQYGAITITNVKSSFSTIKLVVGKNVTLCGWSGIGIMSSFTSRYKNITVDFAGKIISSADTTSDNPQYGHGIYVNGSYQSPDKCPEFIIRETAEIDQGEGTAIYAAGYANWTIYGGKFRAGECFEVKAGNINIIDGVFEATDQKSHAPNNSGTSARGYAIAIVNNNNYAKPLTMTILGGTFKSDVTILEDQEDTEYKASLIISGGNFSNDVSSYK